MPAAEPRPLRPVAHLNTIDFLPVLELGHNLFARKFDPDTDSAILDAIDARRSIGRLTKPEPMFPRVQIKQAGYAFLSLSRELAP